MLLRPIPFNAHLAREVGVVGVEEQVAVEGGAVALVRRIRGAEGRYSVMS